MSPLANEGESMAKLAKKKLGVPIRPMKPYPSESKSGKYISHSSMTAKRVRRVEKPARS